MIRDKFN